MIRALLASLVVFPLLGIAGEIPGLQERCGQCFKGSTQEAILDIPNCVANNVARSTREDLVIDRGIACLARLWENRSGALSYEISDGFIRLLEASPKGFIRAAVGHENTIESWLSEVDTLSFTWFKAPPSPLPARQKRILKSLKDTKDLSAEERRLNEKLQTRIRQIKPRQID